jgi:hypothetical protein
MTDTLKILMAQDNPNGLTVEQIIEDVVHDLSVKNKRIDEDQTPFDKELNDFIKTNNMHIMNLFAAAYRYQTDTMDAIDQWKKGDI